MQILSASKVSFNADSLILGVDEKRKEIRAAAKYENDKTGSYHPYKSKLSFKIQVSWEGVHLFHSGVHCSSHEKNVIFFKKRLTQSVHSNIM